MNNHSCQQNPLMLDDFLPKLTTSPLGRSVKTIIEKTLGLSYLAEGYTRLNTNGQPDLFVKEAFNALDITTRITQGDIANIPKTGATIVVANHPYGAIDGMAMIELLKKCRSDIKIMANGLLKRVPEIRDIVLSVNPYGHNAAKKQNMTAMRDCLKWLKSGGLIFMFPSGDVSSLNLTKLSIGDSQWDKSIARLALISAASVVPVHINGRNSAGFYLAGAIHPGLKTIMLPRQIINKRGSIIDISIGTPIDTYKLNRLGDADAISTLLMSRTYMLSQSNKLAYTHKTNGQQHEEILQPVQSSLLCAEIYCLPAEQKLIESGDLQVFYATASQIPWTIEEIGRLREISFRQAGEGTGNEADIDEYDEYYTQLFIWNKKSNEIVGGYRLGLTDKILQENGLKGLYTYSLFKMSKSFFEKSAPAIELGRSFVRIEYQRNFSPLMLLWKGITQFVYQHPQYCILFGGVSISNSYTMTSQQLLINYLTKNLFNKSMAKYIKPRTPYKGKKSGNLNISTMKTMNIDNLSSLISSIEEDGKGIPVLIRQYLKLNGELLGFNIDHQFGDCIDGLIRVDLRTTDKKILAKYMGKKESEIFISHHEALSEKIDSD